MGRIVLSLMILLLVTLFSCILAQGNADSNIVEGTGSMTYQNFEGGFYGIVADDGTHYDPINLPSEFKKNGLRVKFKGIIKKELVSFHMWGSLLELLYIEKL